MNSNKKKEIVSKFKKRKEAEVLRNDGTTLPFGCGTIEIKELPWMECEELQETVIGIVKEVMEMFSTEIDTENMVENLKSKGIVEFLELGLTRILGSDLLTVVSLLTRGEVTKDFIIEKEATKNQVIRIAVEGLLLNYSYLKNLVSLAQNLAQLR